MYLSLRSILVLSLFFSCSNSRVEDFFVPEFPLKEEYFEINRNEGYGKILKYDFTLFKSNYKLTFDIEEDLYNDVKSMSKQNQYDTGLGMRQDQYDVFVYDNNDEYVLNTIVDAITQSEGKNNYDLAQLIVAFVQSIPYDNNAREPKYTVETLYRQTGDCDDKSILLAKLLSYAGYETCLFIYEEGQHMAVGLKVDELTESYKDGYIYIESTGYNPIGNIPESFADNVDIRNEDPKIIEVDIANSNYAIFGYDELKSFYTNVKDKFGDGYFKTTIEGRILLEKIKRLESNITEKRSKIRKKQNTIDQTNELEINTFNRIVKQYNEQIVSYNKLAKRLNEINATNYIK